MWEDPNFTLEHVLSCASATSVLAAAAAAIAKLRLPIWHLDNCDSIERMGTKLGNSHEVSIWKSCCQKLSRISIVGERVVCLFLAAS
jgi:hypothetical protein